jgi:hypothetical protein
MEAIREFSEVRRPVPMEQPEADHVTWRTHTHELEWLRRPARVMTIKGRNGDIES